MHTRTYGAPTLAACKELRSVQCTRAGIELLKTVDVFKPSRKYHRRFLFFSITCSADGLIIFVARIVLADHVIFTFTFKEKKV